jgi:hypothetical protein
LWNLAGLIRVLGAETEPQAVRRLVAALASPSSCLKGAQTLIHAAAW